MYDAIAEALAFLEGLTKHSADAAHQLEIVKSYISELQDEIDKWEEGTYVAIDR